MFFTERVLLVFLINCSQREQRNDEVPLTADSLENRSPHQTERTYFHILGLALFYSHIPVGDSLQTLWVSLTLETAFPLK